ncbi:ABC transporter permease [Leucobacter ruminantium]|uniref:ABC transporter permease n=1 Tax=Leucobacter ruminantium TaxID=1289170 RepID=A0A939RXY8_9MICO|nr:ABC transporter permease [Leucobacter ruminantium]MBO1803919.1 ABC transporter permease [Leucobacter ruminantium]
MTATTNINLISKPGQKVKPQQQNRLRRFVFNAGPPVLVFILFIALWWVVSATIYADRNYLLPRPPAVIKAMVDNWSLIAEGTWITFTSAVTGFALAIVLGMLGAVIMSLSKGLERSFYPYAVLLQTVPIVAVAPVIVLWFGYNQNSVIVIAFMIAVFPILNNTMLGLASADRNQIDLFRMHRANKITEFTKLRFPGALPNIFAGLRISAGMSVIGAIVGEFIIGSGGEKGGLGVKVIFAQARLQTDLLFAEVIAATLLGFVFFMVVSWIGNLSLRSWHESALKADA